MSKQDILKPGPYGPFECNTCKDTGQVGEEQHLHGRSVGFRACPDCKPPTTGQYEDEPKLMPPVNAPLAPSAEDVLRDCGKEVTKYSKRVFAACKPPASEKEASTVLRDLFDAIEQAGKALKEERTCHDDCMCDICIAKQQVWEAGEQSLKIQAIIDNQAEQLKAARETQKRIHRRCQTAESAARATIEKCKREGVNICRVLLAQEVRDQAEQLKAQDEALRDIRRDVGRDNVMSVQDIEERCDEGLKGQKKPRRGPPQIGNDSQHT